jgi:hypothetical protein
MDPDRKGSHAAATPSGGAPEPTAKRSYRRKDLDEEDDKKKLELLGEEDEE